MANFFIITKTVRKVGHNTTNDRQVREFSTLEDINAQMLEDYNAYTDSQCYEIEKATIGYCSGVPTYFKAVCKGKLANSVHEAFLVKVGEEAEETKSKGLVATNGQLITGRTWDHGVIDGYHYSALVFPEASEYGINGSNVSKLSITAPSGKLAVNYDRGWDVKPSSKNLEEVVNKVLARYAISKEA